MRCLSSAKQDALAQGNVLHDWHAEVIAIRAFNHFLLQEASNLASSSEFESTVLRRRESNEISQVAGTSSHHPFTIFDDLKIMMYCSEAPCGDASMELVMEAQDDATPWPITLQDGDSSTSLLGRGSFSQLGVVRRKPGKLTLVGEKRSMIDQKKLEQTVCRHFQSPVQISLL